MLRLYDYLDSGNGYKVRLLLTQLGIPFTRIEIDILKGESRTLEFLRKNPNGRIPVLELENGQFLAESNAILCYLADGSHLLPTARYERAQILQWMFFEQYSHEPNIATSRFWLKHLEPTGERKITLEQKRALGYAALDVMEKHLADRSFFVGSRYTVADIALYAYTHVAYEGGFELNNYLYIRAWLERVRMQPGHISITQSPSVFRQRTS
ncbi:MAG: glutathione S-transferase family protein [Candidatus Binatia bacterium]